MSHAKKRFQASAVLITALVVAEVDAAYWPQDRKKDSSSDQTSKAARQAKGKKTPTPEELGPEFVETARKIGTREVGPIEHPETFYFRNGRYFTRPYTIRRTGYALYLNDVEIDRLSPLPHGHPKPLAKVPELPEQITAKSSWKEVEQIRIDGTKDGLRWRVAFPFWFYTHYETEEEASKQFVDALRKLPFVKTVEWVTWEMDRTKRYLRVVSHAGDERHFFTSWWSPDLSSGFDLVYGPPDPEKIIKPHSDKYVESMKTILEKRIQVLEGILRSGDLVFISDFGPLRVSRERDRKDWSEIVNIVAILKSEIPTKQKMDALAQRLIKREEHRVEQSSEWKIVENLVENFKGDPQLDQRIEDLRKKVTIPLWEPPAQRDADSR